MTINAAPHITLDHNGQIPIELQVGGPSGDALTIDMKQFRRPQNLGGDEGHFQQGMKLTAGGKPLSITPYYDSEQEALRFEGTFPQPLPELTLSLYGQPILTLERGSNGEYHVAENHKYDLLSVDELRMLATSDIRQDHVPADRARFKGFDPAKHAPITDLHTHSSAQLSNAELINIALSHHLDYPVELLKKLNINLSDDEKQAVKVKGGFGARFSPVEHEKPLLKCEMQNEPCDVIPLSALTPAHRQILQDQLQVPQDMTLSFSDFDRQYYRFVNPLVKNPTITKDMLMAVARDYQKKGVKYAELSTASMLNLDPAGQATWFREMSEAVAEAEKETGVQLRFLIGVPRSYGPAKVMVELEKIKYAARHPLIAGVDLLGYEANRTSDFSAALSHIADWARAPEGTDLTAKDGWDFKRDFTIRIHAGETGKNSDNVAEAVRIAEDFGVHVRVAHAVNEATDHALDKKINELSSRKPPLVSMEFCPSSNLAYNNIQDLREVPFERWLKCCKSWFLGSDGGGAIQTTPIQQALGALAGGCKLDDLAHVRKTEEKFIADAQERFTKKTEAFNKLYGKDGQNPNEAFLKEFAQHVKQVNGLIDPKTLDPSHPELPARFEGRMPILIAGSADEASLSPLAKENIRQSMRMLVASVDPKKAYFVVGRSKSDGVTAALDDAIMAHNKTHPQNKFRVLALITEDIPDLPRSISWVVPQPGSRGNVPQNIIDFMRGNLVPGKLPGVSIFIGGSAFTGDMILKCRQNDGLAYLLMEDVGGMSASFAKKVNPNHIFNTGKSLLVRLAGIFGDHGIIKEGEAPFRGDINVKDNEQMQKLAEDARVAEITFVKREAARKSAKANALS